MSVRLEVTVYDGKYTVRQNENGSVDILRYGAAWRDNVQDNVILALASEVEELQRQLPKAEAQEEVADDFAIFVADARVELRRAQAAWPDGDVYVRLAALAGEVGELAQGTIKKRPLEALRAEALQVAVTAYRVVQVLFGWPR